MCDVKLYVAIMFSVIVMQLHGSSTSSVSDSVKRSSDRSGLMDRLREETLRKESSPRFQLAEKIRSFKQSPFVVNVRNSKSLPHAKTALLNCVNSLNGCRSQLENERENHDIVGIAAKVQQHLGDYKTAPHSVLLIINSPEFQRMEIKCNAIIDGSGR